MATSTKFLSEQFYPGPLLLHASVETWPFRNAGWWWLAQTITRGHCQLRASHLKRPSSIERAIEEATRHQFLCGYSGSHRESSQYFAIQSSVKKRAIQRLTRKQSSDRGAQHNQKTRDIYPGGPVQSRTRSVQRGSTKSWKEQRLPPRHTHPKEQMYIPE
jgi:hypothetical protein